jgi:DNA-binding transcriptional regulator/RsmH inhibitor MraZ
VTAWFRPRWKLAVLASSAAAVLAAVTITKVWPRVTPVGPGGEVKRRPQLIEKRAIVARFKERAECALSETGRRMERLEGSWLDVSAIVEAAGDEKVVLTGTIDLSQQENCLLAFRASDWELFADRYERAAEGPELERFRRIASAKHVVPVRDGRIEIPQVLLVKHVSGPDVVVLRLEGRAEIWSPASLEAYTAHGIPRAIGVDLEG